MTDTFNNFADFNEFYNEQISDAGSDLAASLTENNGTSQLSVFDEPTTAEMPDEFVMQRAIEMSIQTMFDALRDTRLEEFSQDIAWGFVNSLHMTSKRIERRQDDADKRLRELTRCYDPSEIYATELEEAQLVSQSLFDAEQAIASMRDYAAAVYHVETNQCWAPARGSKIAVATGASHIDAQEALAARAAQRRAALTPEGPFVAFSGGSDWTDHQLIWDTLDRVKERIPSMVLIYTAQTTGADKFAATWAQSRGVQIIAHALKGPRSDRRRGFRRNEALIAMKPVHAVVCDGSGLQEHLRRELTSAGIPQHKLRATMQHQRKAA